LLGETTVRGARVYVVVGGDYFLLFRVTDCVYAGCLRRSGGESVGVVGGVSSTSNSVGGVGGGLFSVERGRGAECVVRDTCGGATVGSIECQSLPMVFAPVAQGGGDHGDNSGANSSNGDGHVLIDDKIVPSSRFTECVADPTQLDGCARLPANRGDFVCAISAEAATSSTNAPSTTYYVTSYTANGADACTIHTSAISSVSDDPNSAFPANTQPATTTNSAELAGTFLCAIHTPNHAVAVCTAVRTADGAASVQLHVIPPNSATVTVSIPIVDPLLPNVTVIHHNNFLHIVLPHPRTMTEYSHPLSAHHAAPELFSTTGLTAFLSSRPLTKRVAVPTTPLPAPFTDHQLPPVFDLSKGSEDDDKKAEHGSKSPSPSTVDNSAQSLATLPCPRLCSAVFHPFSGKLVKATNPGILAVYKWSNISSSTVPRTYNDLHASLVRSKEERYRSLKEVQRVDSSGNVRKLEEATALNNNDNDDDDDDDDTEKETDTDTTETGDNARRMGSTYDKYFDIKSNKRQEVQASESESDSDSDSDDNDEGEDEVEWFRYAPPKIDLSTLDVPMFEKGVVTVGMEGLRMIMEEEVAASVRLGGGIKAVCENNARAYKNCGEKARAWMLLSLLTPDSPIISKIVEYYHSISDFQMVSLIVAIFSVRGFRADVRVYAEVLYGWGFLELRLELLKTTGVKSVVDVSNEGLGVGLLCFRCGKEGSSSGVCGDCKRFASRCSICHDKVRGAAIGCLDCGHGGCLEHITSWFGGNDQCPTGCGCTCLSRQYSSKEKKSGRIEGGWKDGRPLPVASSAAGKAGGREEEAAEIKVMPSLREMRGMGSKKGVW
jgi:hypothetical protein